MSFTLQTLATIGGAQIDAPTVYSYKSADSLATVVGTAYFVDKVHEFEVGDLIFALVGGSHAMLEVLTDTSTVKVVDISQSDRLDIIVAPDADYTHVASNDLVYMTGTNDFDLLPVASGYKFITIKNEGVGTITIVPNGSETTQHTSLSATQSVTLAPGGAAFSWSVVA